MANKPTQPVFPLGLAAEEQSTLAGVLNTGTIEHGPDAVLTLPEGNASAGLPSSVRYNADSDEFEGFYENGGWLPLGGGGIRWEVLPHASTATLTEGRGYLINNTTGASTVVLPSPTRIGDSVTICDAYGKFATYPLTVSPSGNNLYGSTEDMAITTDNVSATFTWSGPEQGWIITSGVGLGQGRVYSREIFTKILASETSTVNLNTPPTIVDVYADGKRLAESKYSLDGNVITFSPSLPANTELQVIEYTPIQLGTSGGSGSSTITWVYNGGSAIGGETEITLDVVVDDVPAIDINGSRQYKNLGFTFDPLTSKITLAQELEPEDEVVVIINGTPNIYNQIDHTLREVARVTNVKDTEVVYFSVGAVLSGYKVIYDKETQRAYPLPADIAPGTTAVSLSSSAILVHSAGSVDLGELAVSREEYVTLSGSFDTGVTVNTKNELVVFTDGKYRWDGELPKEVSAGSTPGTAGGIGLGKWVSVGDASLRTNLASGSGSSLVTYTNPNGPGVPMPLDVRIGQTYFMSDYGVSPSSTAAQNTARINAVFAALGGQPFIAQFVFDCKGVVLINDSLLLKNNMDILIHAGTEIKNVAGTNRPVFISEYWFNTISNPLDLTKKSDYLGIRGDGIINYNKSGTAPGGLNTHAICIAGVKRLKLGGGLKVGGAFKYAYLVANIDYLDAQGLEFDNQSDGLHLQPPIYHAYVRNLRGHTGDDLFAMTGGDYASYDLGTRGNFTFIDVEGLFNDTTLCAVKLAGNDGVEFKHVSVRGIHGTCQHAPIRIWADHNLTKTTVKYAGFNDISAIPGAGHALCEIYDRGLGEVFADQVVVEGVSTNLTNISTPVVDVRGSVGVTVYNLDMDVPRNSKFGFACGDGSGNDKSRIFNVNIKSKNTSLSADQYSSLCLVTRGVVDNVTIKGAVDHKAEATLCQMRGGTLKNINISDMVYSNGHLFRQFAANADTSLPTVILSNVTGTNSGKLAMFYSGGRVTASNVTLLSTSGNPIETTAAGIVDVYGAINYGNSLIPSTVTSGFNYRVYGFGLTVDAANLQRTGNQCCNNNNSSFGTGAGLIAFAPGTGWKNLVTGATG